MVNAFIGTWKCVDSKNFAQYLTALGAPPQIIKNASSTNPTTLFSKEGDKIAVKIEHGPPTMTNTEVTFTLGDEFDEHTSDGRKCKSLVTIEDGKMVYVQRWEDDKTSTAVREIQGDKMMLCLSCAGVQAERTYVKA